MAKFDKVMHVREKHITRGTATSTSQGGGASVSVTTSGYPWHLRN